MNPLHPQTQGLVDAMARMNLIPPDKLSVEQAREQFRQSRVPFVAPAEAVDSAKDATLPGPGGGLRIRMYRPLGSRSDELLPGLVYFHGGGWVFGDLDSHDPLCRELCNLARCAVVAVDYRLAPENRFPAAVEDAISAIRYVAQHAIALGIDGARLAAGGDSAGGNLAAVAALTFRDQGGPELKLQLLIYPVTDFSMEAPSYTRIANGFTFSKERMSYFRGLYLRGPEDAANWRASPLKVKDLSRLPPALLIAAGHDPLVDEGKAYADRLEAAGVPVTYTCYDGMVHGFVSMAGAIDAGHTAIAEAAAVLKRVFSPPR
jgi:acetyl esterase